LWLHKEKLYYYIGYVGSQADKFKDAAKYEQLLTTMPELQNNLAFKKNSSKKDIETERITQDNIILAI
jgi:hypothetical protein